MSKDSLLKKIITVLVGGVLAQLITFSAIPFITRIYSPNQFGLFANVTQIAAFLIPVISVCLPLVVVLIKNNDKAKCFVNSACYLNFLIAFFILSILFIASPFINEVNFYIWLFAILFALASAVQEVFLYYYIKQNYFLERAKILIVQAIVVALLKVFIGCFYKDEFTSLSIASLLGYLLSNLFIFYRCEFNKVKIEIGTEFRARVRRHQTLIKYRAPLNIIDNLTLLLPVLYLTNMVSPAVAGLYALARVVLVMPAGILGKSVADVMLPKCVELHRQKMPIKNLLKKYSFILCFLVSPFLLFFIFISEKIFTIVFGEEWRAAAVYANWLTLWVAINIINKPYSVVIPIFKIEKIYFYNGLLNLTLTVLALLLSVYLNLDAINTVALLTSMSLAPQLLVILIGHNNVKKYDNSL